MNSTTIHQPEELLARLVHDLRQPLSTIENSLYLTQLLLNPEQARAREQLRVIEHQVDQAAVLLSEAAAELVRLRGQRTAAESFSRTNAMTAGVT